MVFLLVGSIKHLEFLTCDRTAKCSGGKGWLSFLGRLACPVPIIIAVGGTELLQDLPWEPDKTCLFGVKVTPSLLIATRVWWTCQPRGYLWYLKLPELPMFRELNHTLYHSRSIYSSKYRHLVPAEMHLDAFIWKLIQFWVSVTLQLWSRPLSPCSPGLVHGHKALPKAIPIPWAVKNSPGKHICGYHITATPTYPTNWLSTFQALPCLTKL